MGCDTLTVVTEELISSIIRMKMTGELGITSAENA
jgi:hypothetical protein